MNSTDDWKSLHLKNDGFGSRVFLSVLIFYHLGVSSATSPYFYSAESSFLSVRIIDGFPLSNLITYFYIFVGYYVFFPSLFHMNEQY